jgi:2-methylfumaryl-CoA isomerase
MRIVEGSAFVAAPLCGLTLAQLGAEVIRFDQIGGGLDYGRWPLGPNGRSLYWAGLNKGKRSIGIDLKSAEGRELAVALATADGPDAGIFVTNFPDAGWLGYEALRARRADLIHLNIMGNADGSSAVDYTVNCAVGLPFITGDAPDDTPVNHTLPAWDIATGHLAAVGVLAAERHRRLTGEGQRVKLPLSDVAFAAIGALGHIAETELGPVPRRRYGNALYGAFGRDFATGDGRRVMIVAITPRQWTALVGATGIAAGVADIEARTGLDLGDEGERFAARGDIAALIAPWCAARTLGEIAEAFGPTGVCWGPYQTFHQMLAEDPRCSPANAMFGVVEHGGVGDVLTPASPLAFDGFERTPAAAPVVGQDTDAVLAEVLKLPEGAIADLHDRGIVG